MTDSVIRSCRWTSSASLGRCAAEPDASLKRSSTRVPRSTRTTQSNPQLRAMSVALLDHGETVPGLGTTSASRDPAQADGSNGSP